ncbi:hypothetical protein ACQY0O_005375 [Thecaphora frezii]
MHWIVSSIGYATAARPNPGRYHGIAKPAHELVAGWPGGRSKGASAAGPASSPARSPLAKTAVAGWRGAARRPRNIVATETEGRFDDLASPPVDDKADGLAVMHEPQEQLVQLEPVAVQWEAGMFAGTLLTHVLPDDGDHGLGQLQKRVELRVDWWRKEAEERKALTEEAQEER